MKDENTQEARAIGNDLKRKIMDVVETHPAMANSGIILAVLFELAITLTVTRFGSEARDMWIEAFDESQPAPPLNRNVGKT